jgi:hypothetical protein
VSAPKRLSEFVSHAVEVEQDVAIQFDAIAAVASDCSSQEVEKSFRQLAEFSRLHLAAVKSRAGNVDVTPNLASQDVWDAEVGEEYAA